jgi:hypothetical protein
LIARRRRHGHYQLVGEARYLAGARGEVPPASMIDPARAAALRAALDAVES